MTDLTQKEIDFLRRLNKDGSPTSNRKLASATRAEDRLRQALRRRGFIVFGGTPAGWRLTSKGMQALGARKPDIATIKNDDLDLIAWRLWKAEICDDDGDGSAPPSVVEGRVLRAFLDQAPQVVEKWRRVARAALAAIQDMSRCGLADKSYGDG